MLANLAGNKRYDNAARKLHQYLHASGKTFPVQISTARITIRRLRKRGGELATNYPIILLSSWLHSILQLGGQFLLGGWTTQQKSKYEGMFARFWERYKGLCKDHPVHQKPAAQQMRTIPIAFHGDEGRGLCKEPVLVESYQPVIPWSGEDNLNMRGHFECIGKTYCKACLPNV